MTTTPEIAEAMQAINTGQRHFIVLTAGALYEGQPLTGFTTEAAALKYLTTWTLLPENDHVRIQALPAITGEIAAFVRDGSEDIARHRHGDAAVDAYFQEVEGIDAFAARVDVDELARKLEAIGDDVTALAHSIGLLDPGAASTEDLVREMWAKVHTSLAARGPAGVDEGRALGWHA